MEISPEKIRKALGRTLRGETSHKKMMPPNRKLYPVDADKRRIRQSSVLLLLFQEEEELYLCLIKRTATMKHHAGQLAFPGGRIDIGEKPLETALRETWEEIGVAPEKIEILGALSELFIDVSGYNIYPFVGWLNEKPGFEINKAEVEKIILFPLLKYKDAKQEAEVETVSGRMNVPCYPFDGEVIWGATSMILSEFYDVLK
jgi:8-oxo-dGTP pyrophosphatase MutT (NUDIX family)